MPSHRCGQFGFLRDAGGGSTSRNLQAHSLAPSAAGPAGGRISWWRLGIPFLVNVLHGCAFRLMTVVIKMFKVKTSNLLPSRPVCPHFHGMRLFVVISHRIIKIHGTQVLPHQEGRACWQCLVPDIHIYPGGFDPMAHIINRG